MATRPCYRPLDKFVGVKIVDSEFVWNPGMSRAQKQRNVVALHEAICRGDPSAKVLEISSKSLQPLGVSLSAFNLKLDVNGVKCTVESVFQAGKVFEGGVGPFPDLYAKDSREVRHYVQDQSQGRHVIAFELNGVRWSTEPRTAFFFYLYLKALVDNPELGDALMEFDAFSDIEFNPERQINCQAAAAAFYVSLRRQGKVESLLGDREAFCKAVGEGYHADNGVRRPTARASLPAGFSVAPVLPAATERPATGDRIPCPEGFVDAKQFADESGAIETWAKSEDAGIVRLWIPQEVKTIGNFAFKGCPNLEEVVCEECGGGPALALGLMSFAACTKLRKVSLPTRLASVGKGAFRDNTALTEFSVAAGHYPVTCADHVFDNCPDAEAKLSLLK